jgi:hypothetical protein
MIKFIFCCIVLAMIFFFVVGFVKVIHTFDSIPVAIEKKADEQRAADKRLEDWAHSYDGGK